MPRLARISRVVFPPVWRPEGIFRVVERVSPSNGNPPRVIVGGQRWSPEERRWTETEIPLAIVRDGLELGPNSLRALGVPVGSWYAWLRGAREFASYGPAKTRSASIPGEDAGPLDVERSRETAGLPQIVLTVPSIPSPQEPRSSPGSAGSWGESARPVAIAAEAGD